MPRVRMPSPAALIAPAPSGATKVRVRVCNLNGAGAIDVPSLTYRYISFDLRPLASGLEPAVV